LLLRFQKPIISPRAQVQPTISEEETHVRTLRKSWSSRSSPEDAFLAAWNAHEAENLTELFASGFRWHDDTLQEPIIDIAAAAAFFERWATAIPDLEVKQDGELDISAGYIVGSIRITGTNAGEITIDGQTHPSTGRPVSFAIRYSIGVSGDGIGYLRTEADLSALTQQLELTTNE
jgi:SnoaL-like protein